MADENFISDFLFKLIVIYTTIRILN